MTQPTTDNVVTSADGSVIVGVEPPARPAAPQFNLDSRQPQEEPQPQFKVVTLEDIERARQQEKDKLYPQLDELKKTVKELTAEREERIKAEQEAREAAEAAEKAAKEKEMTAKQLVEERTRELQERLDALASERERDRLLLDREREFNELMTYKNSRLQQEDENIMPELRDYIGGNSREEIDASIERAKATTQSILEQVTASQQHARQNMRGVSTTGLAPIGPMDNQPGQETFSAEDIRNMDINTYAKYRDKLLNADRTRRTDRGLYG